MNPKEDDTSENSFETIESEETDEENPVDLDKQDPSEDFGDTVTNIADLKKELTQMIKERDNTENKEIDSLRAKYEK